MGPFRELFVEVAEALLAGAVAQAERPKPVYAPPSRTRVVLDAVPERVRQVPWVRVHVTRSAMSQETSIVTRCVCKRTTLMVLDEMRLEADDPCDSLGRILREIYAFAEQHEQCNGAA